MSCREIVRLGSPHELVLRVCTGGRGHMNSHVLQVALSKEPDCSM